MPRMGTPQEQAERAKSRAEDMRLGRDDKTGLNDKEARKWLKGYRNGLDKQARKPPTHKD